MFRDMPDAKTGRNTETKGICTDVLSLNEDTITSETESSWKSPCSLKREVQTIIDIMGPPIPSNFNYNTSSEADNEESVFSNSKISSEKQSKAETNLSTIADLNTSPTLEDLTDSKVNFPYVENTCNPQYICPPPLLPAHVCLNSECLCPQVASILHGNNIQVVDQHKSVYFRPKVEELDVCGTKPCKNKDSKKAIFNWLKTIVSSSKTLENDPNINEYYKMNIKRKRGDDHSPPRRVVFELVQGASNEQCQADLVEMKNNKNMKNERLQTKADLHCCESKESRKVRKPIEKTTFNDCEGKTRVDVYYFDHGSFNHYQTTDTPPHVTTEEMADKTEKHTIRFWAEIFGTVHIGFSFATSFVLQFFRFILYSLCRPLTIGIIQLASDYFFKPLLVTIFNGVIQPILIFIHNIASSIRDICDPVSEGIGFFLKEIAVLVKSFRIVESVTENCKCQSEFCKCDKKSTNSKKHRIVC